MSVDSQAIECQGDCKELREKDDRYIRLNEIIEDLKDKRGALIPVLHKAQEIFGYLPEELQTHIAERLDIPLSEVCGVVTFYSLFSMKPRGKYLISICLGTACYVKGAGKISDELAKRLKVRIGDTTEDGKYTLEASRCIGACGLAPVLTVNGEVHGRLTMENINQLLEKYN